MPACQILIPRQIPEQNFCYAAFLVWVATFVCFFLPVYHNFIYFICPLYSHFIVIVVTTPSPSNSFAEGTLYPYGDQRAVNYYVAANVSISSFSSPTFFILGDNMQTSGNGFSYQNVPLGSGRTVSVFVRVYSGAPQPVSLIVGRVSLLIVRQASQQVVSNWLCLLSCMVKRSMYWLCLTYHFRWGLPTPAVGGTVRSCIAQFVNS